MSNKRTKSRSGSMLLKFSNTSMTSARATHARNSIDLTPEYANGAGGKRRRFFNSTTDLFPILGLILMSLCRQVTSLVYLQRRVFAYVLIVMLGGVMHDFASAFIRALLFKLPRAHLLNWAFVKYGWAWNVVFLLPFISLSSHALNLLNEIELEKIEKSIDQYHERRLKLILTSQHRASVSYYSSNQQPPPPLQQQQQQQQKTIVSLQSLANTKPLKMIEQCQKRILNSERDSRETRRFTLKWFVQCITSTVSVLIVRDVLRLALCSLIYLLSILSFWYIQSMTAPKHNKPNGSQVAVSTSARPPSSPLEIPNPGLDISGHVFILLFSNLIFLEECNIMTGWEPLGDRLFDLSREFMNIEVDSLVSPFGAQLIAIQPTGWQLPEVNRMLFLAWHRFHAHTRKIHVLFFFCTLLTLVWDFMFVQTSFFYHSMLEKLIAFLWALAAWYIAYRVLFPALRLEVKKSLAFQAVDSASSQAGNK